MLPRLLLANDPRSFGCRDLGAIRLQLSGLPYAEAVERMLAQQQVSSSAAAVEGKEGIAMAFQGSKATPGKGWGLDLTDSFASGVESAVGLLRVVLGA